MKLALLRRLENLEARSISALNGPPRLAILEEIDRTRRETLAQGERVVVDWVETVQGDWWGRERIAACRDSDPPLLPIECPAISLRERQAAVVASGRRIRVLVAGRRFGKNGSGSRRVVEGLRLPAGPRRRARGAS